MLASLSHLNIAGIYGLEESAGISALVMEPGQYRRYTLDPKNDRFAVGKRLNEEHTGTVVFLVNFFDELRRLPPVTERSN